MTERARAILLFTAAVIVITVTALAYRQVFSVQAATHPGNIRPLLVQYKTERGHIFAADGTVLATNEESEDGFRRIYPRGESFATVVGYFDPIRGRSGLEAAAETWLGNGRKRGFDLTLTLKPALQEEAERLLAGKRGAIVALDPRTGAVLAMVSAPTFDPNSLDEVDGDAGTNGALVNRALAGRYPPGSTFKIITAAAALDAGIAESESEYDGPASLPVHGSSVTNYGAISAGRLSVKEAFAKSTNTIFAQLGLELGADRLRQAAQDFGFGATVPFDLPVSESVLAPPEKMDPVMTAWSAIGQGETLATPLQMALTAAAIGHNGLMMEPYLIESVRDYQGALRFERKPRTWRRPAAEETAALVKEMMVETVAGGTGRAAGLAKIEVGGKTGTAEVGGIKDPHAWFVVFAPATDPQVAVAIVVENAGTGGSAAAPIAGELMNEALTRSR